MDIDAELDSLMQEIQNKKSSQPNEVPGFDDFLGEEKVATVDDFDSLFAEFESKPSTQRAVAVTKPQIKRKGKYTVTGAMQGQELNAMLDTLEAKLATITVRSDAKGTCAFCQQPILGDLMTVQGKDYHPEHVFCSICNKRQRDRKYFDVNGLILCPTCHGNRTGFICAACGEPILDRCINAMNKRWHPHHFVCAQCKGDFPNGKYCEYQNQPYCERCFSTVGLICKACQKPITSGGVTALGSNFHRECFGCPVCKKPFGPGFYQHNGLPYCERHYLEAMGIPYCSGCNQPITGTFITAMNKKWHQEHFICSFCSTPLSPDFRESNGRPYCPPCFASLV